jgi:hypothetical protein
MDGRPATTGTLGIAGFHHVRIKSRTRSLDLSMWTTLATIFSIAIHPILALNPFFKQLIRSRGVNDPLRPEPGIKGLRSFQMPGAGLNSYLTPLTLRIVRLAASQTVRQVSTMHWHYLFLGLKFATFLMSPSFIRKCSIRDHDTRLRNLYWSWLFIITISRQPSATKLSTFSTCKTCSRVFADRKTLWNHDQATHKGIRYDCDVVGCAHRATRKANLRRHKRVAHKH